MNVTKKNVQIVFNKFKIFKMKSGNNRSGKLMSNITNNCIFLSLISTYIMSYLLEFEIFKISHCNIF